MSSSSSAFSLAVARLFFLPAATTVIAYLLHGLSCMSLVFGSGLRQVQKPFAIVIYPHHCQRCGYDWNSRKRRPVMCQRCKDRNYNKPRKSFRPSAEKNKQYVSSQKDRDPYYNTKEEYERAKAIARYHGYPVAKIDEERFQDELRREDMIKAMSAIRDSEKKRYPCFNDFFTFPYPVYQKEGGS